MTFYSKISAALTICCLLSLPAFYLMGKTSPIQVGDCYEDLNNEVYYIQIRKLMTYGSIVNYYKKEDNELIGNYYLSFNYLTRYSQIDCLTNL